MCMQIYGCLKCVSGVERDDECAAVRKIIWLELKT